MPEKVAENWRKSEAKGGPQDMHAGKMMPGPEDSAAGAQRHVPRKTEAGMEPTPAQDTLGFETDMGGKVYERGGNQDYGDEGMGAVMEDA